MMAAICALDRFSFFMMYLNFEYMFSSTIAWIVGFLVGIYFFLHWVLTFINC